MFELRLKLLRNVGMSCCICLLKCETVPLKVPVLTTLAQRPYVTYACQDSSYVITIDPTNMADSAMG